MINDCSHKNKLVRDGASQNTRVNQALNPSYASIDERSLLDLMAFLKKYATELSYYNQDNSKDGTWEVFFQHNCVCFLTDIAAFDSKKAQAAYKSAAEKINSNLQVKRQLKNQFDLLITLLFESEKWFRNIEKGLKLYNEVQKEIGSVLSLELLNVISYYKKAIDISLIDNTDFDTSYDYNITSSDNILIQNDFSEIWYRYKDPVTLLPYGNWSDYYASISMSEIYQPSGTLMKKARYSQYFLQKSFNKILSSYARLLKSTDVFLDDMLTNYPSHEPHIGLLLSFLQLFNYARDQINTLTQRHLDFYLQELLGLEKKEAVSDKAFVIFELAKSIDEYKVAKDTSLSAGKDDTGIEVLFNTTKETVFNKAAIAELRNIFIDDTHDYRVYASPIANSSDGEGGEFTEDPGKWKPFGEEQLSLTTGRTMPDASVGFLITSDTFEMSEGNRTIKIDISCDLDLDDLSSDFNKTSFNLVISGGKGWIEYTPTVLISATANESVHKNHLIFNQNLIQILIQVTEDKGPIVAMDSTIHDSRFDLETPAVFIECSHSSDRFAYGFLKDIKVNKIDIIVSSDKTKNLLLQCDQSVLDPSKPFNPFGTIPKVGSSFIVGSREVFNKKLTKLQWLGTWSEFPVDGIYSHYLKYNKSITYNSFSVTAKKLLNGIWTNIKWAIKLFKGDKNIQFDITLYDSSTPMENATIDVLPAKYDITSLSGFLKIELETHNGFAFGHQIFPKIYAEEALEQAIANKDVSPPVIDLPNQPYTPAIKDFYITYTAKATIDFGSSVQEDDNDGKLYQVHPFGYFELQPTADSESLFLLPQFGTSDGSTLIRHKGELFIGFENSDPPAALELLFKVAEGSENPESLAPEVNWFYLQNDEWIKFLSTEILADNTKNLTTTGILSLSVPKPDSLKTDILQEELLWIKASVTANTDAACDIIEIHPQAVLTEFSDNDNDLQRTATALAAGSIAKLKIKDTNIKSISQPYASFNGQVKETSDEFYLRTSERLRHKQRGITIWDYERIILQEFPDLYKVKCINHTAYGKYETSGSEMDSEFAPGYVTIIVIPKTYNQNAINPYEPKVTKARILQIEELIAKKISPFAAENLKILNPLYEQIQLEFEVEFHKQYTDRGYYEKQLNDDIKKFLSPWAYTEGKDIILGGKMYKSVLIDYVEELIYVDYLKNVKMNHYVNNELYLSDLTTAYPTKARSAFVTINDADITKEHIIKEIS